MTTQDVEDQNGGYVPARERLTIALIDAGASPVFITKAMSGYYGDFTSIMATPITLLVEDARAAGLDDIAARATKGEFDGR